MEINALVSVNSIANKACCVESSFPIIKTSSRAGVSEFVIIAAGGRLDGNFFLHLKYLDLSKSGTCVQQGLIFFLLAAAPLRWIINCLEKLSGNSESSKLIKIKEHRSVVASDDKEKVCEASSYSNFLISAYNVSSAFITWYLSIIFCNSLETFLTFITSLFMTINFNIYQNFFFCRSSSSPRHEAISEESCFSFLKLYNKKWRIDNIINYVLWFLRSVSIQQTKAEK